MSTGGMPMGSRINRLSSRLSSRRIARGLGILGIASSTSFFATGLALGTMPCSPYSDTHSLSIEQPRNAAHLAAKKNDGRLCPLSIMDKAEVLTPMPRAITPMLLKTWPEGAVNGCDGTGPESTPRRGVMTLFCLLSARARGRLPSAPVLFALSLGLLLCITPLHYTP